MRNVVKFFYVIVNQSLESEGFRVIRQNFEEIVLQGPQSHSDVRIVNVSAVNYNVCEPLLTHFPLQSYPSKVSIPHHQCMPCLPVAVLYQAATRASRVTVFFL